MRPTASTSNRLPLSSAPPARHTSTAQPFLPADSGPFLRSQPDRSSAQFVPNPSALNVRSLLELAARTGNCVSLTKWISAGGSLASFNEARVPLLAIAAQNRQTAVVELLLVHGANPNLSDSSGQYPLMHAVRASDERAACALLRSGALPNLTTAGGISALQLAVEHERAGIVDVLLQGGADMDQSDASGVTVFERAIARRHVPVVEAFVRRKMRLAQMPDDMPAIWYCAQEGQLNCLLVLTRCGPDIPKTTWRDMTPELLAYWGGHGKVVDWLLSKKAKNPGPLPDAGTVFIRAAFAGDLSTLDFLFKRFRVDVNYADANGNFALHQAALVGSLQVVKYLQARGANMLALCKDFSNAAQYFAIAGNLEGVKYMVEEHGIRLDHRNLDGDTLMHFAAHWGHMPILTYLLACGADPHAFNVDGETPEDVARAKYSRKIDPTVVAKRKNPSIAADFLALLRQQKPAPRDSLSAPSVKDSAVLLKGLQDALDIGKNKQVIEKLVREALSLGARPTEEMLARALQDAKMACSIAAWRPEKMDDAMSAKRIIYLLMDSLGWQVRPANTDRTRPASRTRNLPASYTPISQQPVRRALEAPGSAALAVPPHRHVFSHGVSSSSKLSCMSEDSASDSRRQSTAWKASSTLAPPQPFWYANPPVPDTIAASTTAYTANAAPGQRTPSIRTMLPPGMRASEAGQPRFEQPNPLETSIGTPNKDEVPYMLNGGLPAKSPMTGELRSEIQQRDGREQVRLSAAGVAGIGQQVPLMLTTASANNSTSRTVRAAIAAEIQPATQIWNRPEGSMVDWTSQCMECETSSLTESPQESFYTSPRTPGTPLTSFTTVVSIEDLTEIIGPESNDYW